MIFWLYIISILALYFLYKGYRAYQIRESILAKGKVADGVIIDIIKEVEYENKATTRFGKIPIMEYTDDIGIIHQYRISTTSDLFPYTLHTRYKLVYDPEGNNEPLVMTQFGLWGEVVGYVCCGFFLVIWVAITAFGI
jgi:hypothetical protein